MIYLPPHTKFTILPRIPKRTTEGPDWAGARTITRLLVFLTCVGEGTSRVQRAV